MLKSLENMVRTTTATSIATQTATNVTGLVITLNPGNYILHSRIYFTATEDVGLKMQTSGTATFSSLKVFALYENTCSGQASGVGTEFMTQSSGFPPNYVDIFAFAVVTVSGTLQIQMRCGNGSFPGETVTAQLGATITAWPI